MVLYDLHIHTKCSKCGTMSPERLLKLAKKKGLNGIAVTDHNTIKGALAVTQANKDENFRVIIGAEIMTQYGEILAYNLKEEIKSRDFDEVIDEIHKQGGLAVMAHPFGPGVIRKALPKDHSKVNLKKLDGFEILNGRTFPWQNKQAEKVSKELGLTGTAGSDTHLANELGRVYSEFDGEFETALKENKITVHGNSNIIKLLTNRTIGMILQKLR